MAVGRVACDDDSADMEPVGDHTRDRPPIHRMDNWLDVRESQHPADAVDRSGLIEIGLCAGQQGNMAHPLFRVIPPTVRSHLDQTPGPRRRASGVVRVDEHDEPNARVRDPAM